MHLVFELTDLEQNVLTRLDNRRPGATVTIGQNAGRTGSVPLSLSDPALAVAAALECVLRVTLRGGSLANPEPFSDELEVLPLLIARVVTPEETSEPESEGLVLNANDPYFSLERALIREEVGAVWKPVIFAGTDQSQIMWVLVDAGTGDVAKGSLPVSVNRDRTYPPGKDVASALLEMSEVIGGPDFELAPTIASDGTLATLNTFYPRQGSDISDSVVFVHRASPETATGFTYAPAGGEVVNRVLAIGAAKNEEGDPLGLSESPYAIRPGYVAEHAGSIAQYGAAFERQVSLDDVVETATLKAHAEGIIAAAAFPTPYFDFTAAPEQYEDETGDGVPPVFGRDYWIGDTIGCQSYAPGADPLVGDEPQRDLTGRITDATITELPSGQIQVKATCAPEIISAGITGEAVEVLMPETGAE